MFVRVRLLSLGWLLMLTLPPATRGAPSLYHVKVRGGVPLAEQLKVALLPTSRVADSGCVTISTGTAVQWDQFNVKQHILRQYIYELLKHFSVHKRTLFCIIIANPKQK